MQGIYFYCVENCELCPLACQGSIGFEKFCCSSATLNTQVGQSALCRGGGPVKKRNALSEIYVLLGKVIEQYG